MTLYILAGGNDRSYDEYGEKLSGVIKPLVKSPIKILSCQFAKDKDDWQTIFESWKPWFHKYLGEDVELRLASEEKFLEQIDWADVIYLHGGHTWKQEAMIKQYTDLEKYFEGKVVIGSSAGANYLSKTYYSPKRDTIGKGSGITQLNTIVHYGAANDGEISLTESEWMDVVERMKSVVGDEEVTLIPEGEFVVVEK
jgi:peptidase E